MRNIERRVESLERNITQKQLGESLDEKIDRIFEEETPMSLVVLWKTAERAGSLEELKKRWSAEYGEDVVAYFAGLLENAESEIAS